MKTIQLSEEKARTLGRYLASEWAQLAVRIEGSKCEVNTALRTMAETMKSPSFVRRVDKAKANLRAIGDVLSELGATLPTVDRTAFVVPYRKPTFKGDRCTGSKPTKLKMYASSGPRRAAEIDRLVKAIRDQLN